MAATSDNNEDKNLEKTSNISPVEKGIALYLVYKMIYPRFSQAIEVILILTLYKLNNLDILFELSFTFVSKEVKCRHFLLSKLLYNDCFF